MGFPTSNIVGVGSVVDEFVCAVCCQLSEEPLYTACSHVFCKSCLTQWLTHKSVCPKCNFALQYNQVGALKTEQPLAWRLLGRLRCRCPLYGSGNGSACGWEGDYSELGAHLTSSDAHLAEAKGAAAAASAAALNEQANQRFMQSAHRDAIKLYSKAISLMPHLARYRANRGAAWLHVGAYAECIADCTRAIELQPDFTKAHVRLARAHCELGDFDAAAAKLACACSLQPEDAELQREYQEVESTRQRLAQAQAACEQRNFAVAAACVADIIHARSPPSVVLCAARVAVGQGNVDHGLRLALGVLKQDAANADAYKASALALYLKGDLEQSQKHLKQLLKLNPDDTHAARTFKTVRTVAVATAAGRDATLRRDFEGAVEQFTAALDADPQLHVPMTDAGLVEGVVHSPLSAALHADRATALLRLKQWQPCRTDALRALAAQNDCKHETDQVEVVNDRQAAHLALVGALQGLDSLEEARAHLQELLRADPSDTTWQAKHAKLDFELRKRARPDYYALLGVGKVASGCEIKAAYKQRAMAWHPDKHDSAELKERAEEQFKLLGEALAVLGEPLAKQLYDEGHDKAAIEERLQAAERAARENPNDRHRRHGGGGCSS